MPACINANSHCTQLGIHKFECRTHSGETLSALSFDIVVVGAGIVSAACAFVRHQTIELGYLKSAYAIQADSVAFNVQPRLSGQVLIGSSRQYGVTQPAVDSNVMSAMLQQAVEYMPGLSRLSILRSWTGFRAATHDKVPLIGLCPGTDNVYLATGHEGLAITTSLGTAKLLADLLLHRNSAIARGPYLPDRSYVHQ
jgi:D-hydroxyproline dehydrogenase subunit beta